MRSLPIYSDQLTTQFIITIVCRLQAQSLAVARREHHVLTQAATVCSMPGESDIEGAKRKQTWTPPEGCGGEEQGIAKGAKTAKKTH